jgi:hypothetical protein
MNKICGYGFISRKYHFMNFKIAIILPSLLIVLLGCSPTVTVAPPSEPITINLNIKIEHEVRIKVEKDLENVFDEDEGLF